MSRHSTRHVDRKLYAIEFHRCDRCRHIFFSHGHYTLHWCADPEWTKINNRAYPGPVVYPGDSSVYHDQQVESVRSRWTDQVPGHRRPEAAPTAPLPAMVVATEDLLAGDVVSVGDGRAWRTTGRDIPFGHVYQDADAGAALVRFGRGLRLA
jgi:hypothetical protein